MVDLTFLKKFTKEDSKKMSRYIRMYLQAAPVAFDEMEQHHNEEDWEALRIKAHSLKPQADFMGIPELKEILVQIEDKIRSNQTNGVESLLKVAIELHEKALHELKVFLQGLES